MKKIALALSVMAMSVSSAMAATMPSDTDLSAGEASTPITLSGTFAGTAVPCTISSVPSDLTHIIEQGGSDTTTTLNAGEFVVMAIPNYTPQISLGALSGIDPITNNQYLEDMFEARIGDMGASASTFIEPTGSDNMTTEGTRAPNGYQTYKKAVLFQAKEADISNKFEEGSHNISTEVIITCVAD